MVFFKKGPSNSSQLLWDWWQEDEASTPMKRWKLFLERLDGKDFTVEKVERKNVVGMAPLPYTTSSMQMDAANKINFRTRKTMMVAHEAVWRNQYWLRIVQGLITYMQYRFHTRISPVAQNEAARTLSWIASVENICHGSRVTNASKFKMPTKRFVHPASSILLRALL